MAFNAAMISFGGAVIAYFALAKMGATPVAELTAGSANPKDVADTALEFLGRTV